MDGVSGDVREKFFFRAMVKPPHTRSTPGRIRVPSNTLSLMVCNSELPPKAVPMIRVEHFFGDDGECAADPVRHTRMGLGRVFAWSNDS